MKLVSVIVPVYNAENYLSKCIDSILEQSYSEIELILLNDGSKDNSLQILREYEKKSSKIKVVDQKNMGVAKTRNKAIQMASGDYIAFMDNDDFIDVNYIETLVSKMEDADIVISGYRRMGIEKELFHLKLMDESWSKYMVMAPWAKLYRRDFLVKNQIVFLDNNIGEDVYFNLVAYSKTKKIKILDYIGYNWFYNDSSVSNTVQKKRTKKLEFLKLLNASYRDMEDKDSKEVEYYFIRYAVWYFLYSTKGLDFQVIKQEYREVYQWLVEHYPNYKKNPYISFFAPKGETLKNRVIVKIFMILHRLGLAKVFLWLYSKI